MKVEQLLNLLHHPHKTTPEDVYNLQNLLQQYPYFQVGYALLAKAAYEQDRATAAQVIQKAAIYATNRPHLKALLEDAPPFSAPATVPNKAVAHPHLEEEGAQADDDHFINGYINNIRQKAKRPITKKTSLAQLQIIQDFIQKDVHFKPQPQQEMPDEALQLDLTQKSAAFHDNMATENLAQVLVQQGKLQRALEIYDQLILKFPEKRTYFASLIQELKNQR